MGKSTLPFARRAHKQSRNTSRMVYLIHGKIWDVIKQLEVLLLSDEKAETFCKIVKALFSPDVH